MPPEAESQPTGDTAASEPTTSGATIAATLATAPVAGTDTPPVEAVRNSPEYQALQEQLRQTARQSGAYRAEAERLRATQEAQRQAAEAERVQATQQAMQEALGDKAQDFGQFATLLQSDPVAAARRYAEMTAVQSPIMPAAAPAQAAPTDGGVQVPSAPQPPSMGVSASSPLGQSYQQTQDERIASLDEEIDKVVKANQNLSTRARVTDRIRATAMGQYIRRGYIEKMGIDPELTLKQRE